MGIPTPVPPSDEEKSALVERIIRGELTPEQAQQRHGLSRAELKDWVRVYRREARRAFDDRVKTVLSTQGIDMGDLSAAEFSGNVEDMSVAELLQTVQLGGKDAEIRIEHAGELSHIWCIAGQVADAESTQLRGAPAVYRLLSLQRGRIHADFAPVQRTRSIHVSTTALLMEGARRFDESRQLRARLGDTEAVFVPSDRSLAPNVQATPDQFAALRLFDGFRNIEEVVHVSASPDLETLSSILALQERGLLDRVRPSRTSLRELPSVAAGEAPESSFLPMAQSLPQPRPRRHRWVWAVAALGSCTLVAALASRFADLESRQAGASAPPPSAHASAEPAAARRPGPTATESTSTPGEPATPASTPVEGARGPRAPTESGEKSKPLATAFPLCPDGSVLLGLATEDPALAGLPATTTPGTPDAARPGPSPLGGPTVGAAAGSASGAAGSRKPGARPPEPMTPFCMARAEATVSEYERCRERGACDAPGRDGDLPEARLSPELRQRAQQLYGSQCNAGQVGRERHPINCVTYRQASNYCAAAGGRLPTEAEWELAARGTDERRYPWGDAAPGATRLNACGSECKGWYQSAQLDSVFDGVMYDGNDGFAGTAPVASYPAGASRDGIYDLLGNVAEWTSTSVDFGQAQPEAPSAGTYVVRGGSFSSGIEAGNLPALRVYLGAEAHGRGIGFRCVYEPKQLR
jgi:formylglycine-generating enzyme required for sulfatase activity